MPRPLQWGLLMVPPPSRPNQKFANDCTKIGKHRESLNMAFEVTLTEPFEGLHTERTWLHYCFDDVSLFLVS